MKMAEVAVLCELFSLLTGKNTGNLPVRWAEIKSALFECNHEDSLPRFWQRRFYDFNVWSLEKKVEKLQYMHMNPMNRALVTHPKDWPWSSFSVYSKFTLGLIRIDPVN